MPNSPSAAPPLVDAAAATPSLRTLGTGATQALPGNTSTGMTLAAIGATANANGATVAGSVLNLQPASALFGGVLTAGVQNIAGAKTFDSSVSVTGTLSTTSHVLASGQLQGTKVSATSNIDGIAISATLNIKLGAGYNNAEYVSQIENQANGIGHRFNTSTLYAVTSSKLATFENSGTVKAQIDYLGNVEVSTVGAGFILKSPDGTRYRITVANGGALSTTLA